MTTYCFTLFLTFRQLFSLFLDYTPSLIFLSFHLLTNVLKLLFHLFIILLMLWLKSRRLSTFKTRDLVVQSKYLFLFFTYLLFERINQLLLILLVSEHLHLNLLTRLEQSVEITFTSHGTFQLRDLRFQVFILFEQCFILGLWHRVKWSTWSVL